MCRSWPATGSTPTHWFREHNQSCYGNGDQHLQTDNAVGLADECVPDFDVRERGQFSDVVRISLAVWILIVHCWRWYVNVFNVEKLLCI
ncbi:hypothetical protein BpHYR1_027215 [Brachionus plicatilis]|uniref:Uncharacterized protein n=1 Tax=Brachionus plicatilis TaxID=10195 RepID=A0A3M7T7Y9_BRAPC|nr:hypothetical protein BpHYR1_027215 [Brachionus plicatilis]